MRGLGRDFTQITLNGARIETASDSNIDAVSQGRGLDLPLFPTELFRQLTVSKTPTASQVEGAVAANIDLRIARPFDKKGFHFNYTAKGTYQEASEELEPATRPVRRATPGTRASANSARWLARPIRTASTGPMVSTLFSDDRRPRQSLPDAADPAVQQLRESE